jgi:hypothetical protein
MTTKQHVQLSHSASQQIYGGPHLSADHAVEHREVYMLFSPSSISCIHICMVSASDDILPLLKQLQCFFTLCLHVVKHINS